MSTRTVAHQGILREKRETGHVHAARKALHDSRGGRPGDAAQPPPSWRDQVQRRAYQIYEERLRNRQGGDPTSDWLKAEEEIRNSRKAQ